jgi:signal transduction histidine kinase
MNDVFSFVGETLSSADLAALRTLAGILNNVQHAVAEEWSRRLIEVQPEYFAHGVGAPVTMGARMARPDFVELAVRDHGPGIRPEDLHVIFEFFERGNAAGMARGGYGIGLHVVRRLIGLLSGTIQVESAPGQGACFRVTLPVRLPDPRW